MTKMLEMPSSRCDTIKLFALNGLKDDISKLHYRIVILGSAKVGKTFNHLNISFAKLVTFANHFQ